MGGYFMHFIIYTLAMCGLIFFAFFIYKKAMGGSFNKKSSNLMEVEETMALNPRKSLMIVRVGSERFLIASDMEKTSLISKLNTGSSLNIQKNVQDLDRFNHIEDYTNQPQIKSQIQEPVYYKRNDEKIHLELIKSNNPNSPRSHKSDSRISAMKEMAKKINEM